jgi:hypothetical protein
MMSHKIVGIVLSKLILWHDIKNVIINVYILGRPKLIVQSSLEIIVVVSVW